MKIYCGVEELKKNERLGSAKECAELKQVRYYGLKKINKSILDDTKGLSANKLAKKKKLYKLLGSYRGDVHKLKEEIEDFKEEIDEIKDDDDLDSDEKKKKIKYIKQQIEKTQDKLASAKKLLNKTIDDIKEMREQEEEEEEAKENEKKKILEAIQKKAQKKDSKKLKKKSKK